MSSDVTESVFAETISAEASDGCELPSDVQERVFVGGSQRQQQMVVKLSSDVTESAFVEEISVEATDGCELSSNVTELFFWSGLRGGKRRL